MANTVNTNNQVFVSLKYSFWWGVDTLTRDDVPEAAERISEDVASRFGNKALIDKKRLAPFSNLKGEMRRAIESYGLPFMGGWMVDSAKWPELEKKLVEQKNKFDGDLLPEFIAHYPEYCKEWVTHLIDISQQTRSQAEKLADKTTQLELAGASEEAKKTYEKSQKLLHVAGKQYKTARQIEACQLDIAEVIPKFKCRWMAVSAQPVDDVTKANFSDMENIALDDFAKDVSDALDKIAKSMAKGGKESKAPLNNLIKRADVLGFSSGYMQTIKDVLEACKAFDYAKLSVVLTPMASGNGLREICKAVKNAGHAVNIMDVVSSVPTQGAGVEEAIAQAMNEAAQEPEAVPVTEEVKQTAVKLDEEEDETGFAAALNDMLF